MNRTEYCISRYFQYNEDVIQNSTAGNENSLEPSRESVLESSQDLSENSITSDSDELSLSQLTIEDQNPINVLPFFNITPRKMPVSPHFVVEEEFRQNPWAMLVATIFLTKTSAKTARPYLADFFSNYPTPYHVLAVNPGCLEKFFDYIGLKKRAHMIWRLSYQYVSSKWRRASDLYGIGKYGEDAYRIFCLGHTDLDPNDRYLKLYLDWLRTESEFVKDISAVDSECLIEDLTWKYYSITLRN